MSEPTNAPRVWLRWALALARHGNRGGSMLPALALDDTSIAEQAAADAAAVAAEKAAAEAAALAQADAEAAAAAQSQVDQQRLTRPQRMPPRRNSKLMPLHKPKPKRPLKLRRMRPRQSRPRLTRQRLMPPRPSKRKLTPRQRRR